MSPAGSTPAARDAPALEALAGRVRSALAAAYPGWAGGLVPVGQGFEAAVFRTELPPYGTVAVKAPWRRFPGGTYGAEVDCRALLRQERVLAAWAAGAGIPAATPHALHEDDAQDMLVSAYVDGDDRPPDPAGYGALLRRLHATPPPDFVPVVHGASGDFRTAVAAHVVGRLARVEALAGGPLLGGPLLDGRGGLDVATLRAAMPATPRALLHMDFRPVNLRCREGRIDAVLDWSNAAVGDPAFELARMHEGGILTADVLDGYGDPGWADAVPAAARAIYHLDAALMLTLVFSIGIPDPARAAALTARARHWLGALHDLLGAQASP